MYAGFTTLLCLATAFLSQTEGATTQFKAGYAKRDITPTEPMPMWGYGDRHALLSTGVIDPLFAKCVVFSVGDQQLAVVTMDIGRGPTARMMEAIREAVQSRSGVDYVLISGSHTHHGPVIELLDEEGRGKGTFDAAVRYTQLLQERLIEVIDEAASQPIDAKIGWGSTTVDMNRNRHSKIEPKPRETELTVVRVDTTDDKTLAIFVNYAAHPTKLPGADLRFSAEWPGQMMNAVEAALGTNCLFVQGAAGDMSIQTTEETNTIETYGKALGAEVLKVNEQIQTSVPANPSIQCMEHEFPYTPRMDLSDSRNLSLLKLAFFPEFVEAFIVETDGNVIRPQLTSVLLNNDVFWVGVSGEYFCNHSIRLKERARNVRVVFQGYCNGHHLYFPTIEGASEGGYGADARVSWVKLGAGEEIMNQALIDLYQMLGKLEQ